MVMKRRRSTICIQEQCLHPLFFFSTLGPLMIRYNRNNLQVVHDNHIELNTAQMYCISYNINPPRLNHQSIVVIDYYQTIAISLLTTIGGDETENWKLLVNSNPLYTSIPEGGIRRIITQIITKSSSLFVLSDCNQPLDRFDSFETYQ